MSGVDTGCYPTVGRILLMQLIGSVFSVSDYSHGIITPMILFCCQCLTSCPLNTPKDIYSGLLICGVLLDYTGESKRYIPEIMLFLRTVLGAYYPVNKLKGKHASGIVSSRLGVINYKQLTGLRDGLQNSHNVNITQALWSVFQINSNKWDHQSCSITSLSTISCSIMKTLLDITDVIVQRHKDNIGFIELIYLMEIDLISLELHTIKNISTSPTTAPSNAVTNTILTTYVTLLESIQSVKKEWNSNTDLNTIKTSMKSKHKDDITLNYRKPLQYRLQSIKTIQTLVPRYEVNYSLSNKDPSLSKEKVQMKVLSKQLKRESKAAMRELRRDADYLEQEKYVTVTAKKEALKEERHKNYSMLENEQGEINQQVKFGKGDLIKGGGSHVVKKRRV